MRTPCRCLVLAALPSLLACYESPVPISNSALPFDPALTGTWEVLGEAGEAEGQLSVLQFENGNYYMEIPEFEKNGDTTRVRARAYLSEVAGVTFINVQDVQGKDRFFTLYRIDERTENNLTVRHLVGSLPRFGSAEQLRAYVVQHLNDPAIYEEAIRLRRVSSH